MRGDRAGGWLALVLAAVLAVAAAAGVGLAAGMLPPGASDTASSVAVLDEVAVTAMHQDAGYSNNSPLMVAEPGEPRFVVMANRLDAPDFGCALQVSGDRGRTWLTVNPVPHLPEGAEKCYGPEAAFDAEGALHYLFVGLEGQGNQPMGAFLVTSTDRAQTFSEPRAVLGPLNFGIRMAIEPRAGSQGRIHLVWLKATSDPPLGGFGPPPNPILTAHSDDGGITFSDPVQVSDPARQRVVAPALALGPDAAVHVAYYDLGRDAIDYQGLEGPLWEEPWTLVLSSSFDGGRSFTAGRAVDGEILAMERVMLIFTMAPPSLVAGRSGLVCAAWTDARHGDGDAMSRCSGDRGQSWGPLVRLNDDRVGNGVRQYLPRLGLSPSGRVDAVFFDRRDDPRNVRNHVYLTYSTDGGRSFAPNHQVSRQASDTSIGQQYVNASAAGQYEIGARLGLLSAESHAVVAWPDTRHSIPPTTAQDIFAATVALPRMPERSVAARLAGAGVAAAGLGGLFVMVAGRRRRRSRSAP